MKSLILVTHINSKSKTARYSFSLNGRKLSVIDFLNLIERWVHKTDKELWAFSECANVVFIFCGMESCIEAFVADEYVLELPNTTLANLLNWLPHELRRVILENQIDFLVYVDGVEEKYRKFIV